MWNDEDNNPYGTSFERRDSDVSSSADPGTEPSEKLLSCSYDTFGLLIEDCFFGRL